MASVTLDLPKDRNLYFTKDLKFIKMWNTAKEASIELTGDRNEENIAKCARGNSLTSIGYKWFYNLNN
jgi:hypothetical protein